jgi:hypothetical protein
MLGWALDSLKPNNAMNSARQQLLALTKLAFSPLSEATFCAFKAPCRVPDGLCTEVARHLSRSK